MEALFLFIIPTIIIFWLVNRNRPKRPYENIDGQYGGE